MQRHVNLLAVLLIICVSLPGRTVVQAWAKGGHLPGITTTGASKSTRKTDGMLSAGSSVIEISTHTGFHDLAPLYTDSLGNVYVQTGLKKGLLVLSPRGHRLRQLGGLPLPSGDCGPWGIAVGPDRRVYVADCATIWVYGRSGDRPTRWYSPRRGTSALTAAWTVAFDRSGAAYVSDFDNNRIVKISRAGKFLGALATGKVVGPWGLAIDRNGNLVVVEHRADSLAQVAPNGTILRRIDLSKHASPLSPTDVAIGSAGTIYVNARDDDQILKFSSAGKYMGVFVHSGTRAATVMHPMGIATDRRGGLYVSDSGNNRIKKFSPSGALTAVWAP